MKKNITFILVFVCFLAIQAQTTLPQVVYTLDFEGATSVADINGTQVGDGELRQSTDPNFGTYYQNAPNSAVTTKATNYLRIETDGLKKAGEIATDAISIGFWVNPTVANTKFPNINYFYSALYSFYTASNRDLTSKDGWNGPMWVQNTRGWLQINDWAGHWDDFGDAENINHNNTISIDWLAQRTEEKIVENSEGDYSLAIVPTNFNDNWHYVALVLSQTNNTASIYVDAQIFNKWNCNKDFFKDSSSCLFKNLGNYADLYLGGVSQFTWRDPDIAFAYDDFTIYAGPLSEEQQQFIMKTKRGDVDDSLLLQAKEDFWKVLNEYEKFIDDLKNYEILMGSIKTYVSNIVKTLDDNPSVDDYNNGAANILARMEEIREQITKIEETMTMPLAISCNNKGKVIINNYLTFINDMNEINVFEGEENTFVFQPNDNCELRQVLIDGLDVTLSVENNQLTTKVNEGSKMIVMFDNKGSDVNGDGTVDISDVVQLVNIILGQ